MKYDVSRGNEARKWNWDESVRCDGTNPPLAFASGRIRPKTKERMNTKTPHTCTYTHAHTVWGNSLDSHMSIATDDTYEFIKCFFYRGKRTYSCPWRRWQIRFLFRKSAYMRNGIPFYFALKAFISSHMFEFMHICTLPDVTRSHQSIYFISVVLSNYSIPILRDSNSIVEACLRFKSIVANRFNDNILMSTIRFIIHEPND